ncbi:MAG: SMP-30/gluconolactonase/LRE family protein [Caldilineaceae bacterium]|nr:SMP-30/gluconolactonase/LRE family protein [Caldilineaceae bacterium]
MSRKVHVLVDIRALVGEGALWDEQAQVLYWVDILSSALYVYNPATGENRSYDIGQHVGTVVLRDSGGVMLALANGFAEYDLASGKLTILSDPESHLPGNRFNDGKCDPGGRFWAGTMAYKNQSTQGSLYRMDADYSVHKMLGDIGISNGIVWSHDKATMYYIDSIAYSVRAFDYDNASGDIANERVAVSVPREMSVPDGMAIDAQGMLWVAHYGAGCVRCWNPHTGQLLDQIDLPAKQITSCAFGGENLDTLFITSAAQQLDAGALAQQPLAGSLFSVKPGVTGALTYRFAG